MVKKYGVKVFKHYQNNRVRNEASMKIIVIKFTYNAMHFLP